MVVFKREKIRNTSSKRRAYNKKVAKKGTFSKKILKVLFYLLIIFTIVVFVGGIFLYKKIISPLPPITKLKEYTNPQSSVIYDREGNILYTVFREKRTNVEYSEISKNMVNAIVSGEDKRFWTNPGFDLIGLIRAGIEGIKTGYVGGTSTISQQLIKNTFLTNERSYKRKIKEIYLSYQMTNVYTKETILELYLNKIFFGNNAYGIEQASQTYFNKKAIDLDILESSILASMPKGPSLFSPYKYKDTKGNLTGYYRLMGYPYVYPKNITKGIKKKLEQDILIDESRITITPNVDTSNYNKEILALKDVISAFKITKLQEDGNRILICGIDRKNFKDVSSIDTDGCTNIEYSYLLNFLNNIRIEVGENYVEYQTGRKDAILGRMFEDGKLSNNPDKNLKNDESSEVYKNSIIDGILFEFKESKVTMKYPYFVFYVKQILEDKYGKTAMEEGGFKVYTTLDPKLQDKAEEIVKKHAKNNLTRFGANNAASITIDNKEGEILTMVGGIDYYNKEIDGENNLVTSRLQPGSTFKPFVYALAMEKNSIGPKTPVFDTRTVFPGGYTPNNFDGRFMNKMPIEKALNHSRNIPAIKMYYLAGKEKSIIDFMTKLGVNSYYDFKKYYLEKYAKEYYYGSPMALGTGEMTMLELATAYSTIATLGNKKEITPILKILDNKGNTIYLKNKDQVVENNVIKASTAYLITSILINKDARPSSWNTFLTIPGRVLAAKTGTSTKQFKDKWGNKKIYPQNLWTIGYTPQYTTIAWAGNTDGKQLYLSGNGLEGAGPIMKDIMIEAHKGKKAESWIRPKGIKSTIISTNSGKLPTKNTPKDSKVEGSFINLPTTFDDSYFSKEIDILCNGKITDDTPKEAIKFVKGVRYHSLMPTYANWENPVLRLSTFGGIEYTGEICERSEKPSNMELGVSISNHGTLIEGSNYVELAYRSTSPIMKLEILLEGKLIASYDLPGKNEGIYRGSFNITSGLSGTKNLIVKAVDSQFYSKIITKTVILGGKDTVPPIINLENPFKEYITLKKGTGFNLRASFEDISPIRIVNVYLNGVKIPSSLSGRNMVLPISSSGLEIGDYSLRIEAIDMHFNKGIKNIKVTIID